MCIRDSNWDDTLSDGMSVADYVKASVLSSVKQHLVLENLASKYDVTLTAEQEAAMAESDQSYIDQYGSEEAFEAEIAKLGMRRETYDRVARSNYLYQNLYELYNTEGSALYASDEDLAVYADEQGYITADHILLATKNMTTGEALTDEQKAEKKALAEELVEKLNSYTGDDIASYFAELADEYSEDPGRETYPTGYTFTTGSMVQEFEDAAYALSEGEVSEVVESSFGYHILLRLPLDKNLNGDTKKKHPDWELIDCPLCGQKCWKMPAADKLKEAQDVTYLCTECAIKAGFLSDYPRNRRKPGGNREQRRRAKRNARR